MPDFFQQQDIARKRTGLLTGYFILAVIGIMLAVYGVITGVLVAATKQHVTPSMLLDWRRLTIVAGSVGVVILLGTLYKILSLQEGGSAVARLLGGELVNPGTADLAERKLLNVVEEMALASGTPVPSVYLLRQETSINAFAAGFGPGDAVIAVNRGTLDRLTRDELQGVIAHEFSHILNGDMRLNLRLIGLLHGILLIALIGYLLLRTSGNSSNSKDNKGALAMLALGIGLCAIGGLGVFFGRLIKAAISREREFLADASAVQFTRNPDGIAGALKKIGGLGVGSRLQNPNAEQASHMFFGPGVSFWAEGMATHPPLAERIRRIDPSFDGVFPKSRFAEDSPAQDEVTDDARAIASSAFSSSSPSASANASFAANPASAVASIGAPSKAHLAFASGLLASLPGPAVAAAREPFGARALIYAILLDPDVSIRRAQIQIVESSAEPGTAAEVLRLAPWLESVGEEARLPLAELAMPSLRLLSERQYDTFRRAIEPLIRADRRVSLFEYALQRMIVRHLDHHFSPPPRTPPRFDSLTPLTDECAVIVGTLSRIGNRDEASATAAFTQGVQALRWEGTPQPAFPTAPVPLPDFDNALSRFAAATAPIKKRLLDAAATCIMADGRVTVAEGELLRAIADSLDCPMPPILAAGPR